MSRVIKSHVQTDIGRKRQTNEDNFIWVEGLWGQASLTLLGAIDGVGGYAGGAEASAIARRTIEGYLQNFRFGAPLALLKEALINANNVIFEKRYEVPEFNRMSCVLSVALLDADKELMYIGHVGDSRGYIFRDGNLLKITKDHSLVGYKEDNGFLTEAEAMSHPQRNEISKMLGEQRLDADDSGQYLDVTEHSFLPGDIVLFCSDGLTDLVNRSQMAAILEGPGLLEQKGQALVDQANELGGKDNITVALASFTAKTSRGRKATKKTIEIPIQEQPVETAPPATPPSSKPPKKKGWFWLFPVLFLVGFLANWVGTKKILHPESEDVRIDTIYLRDSIPAGDTVALNDDTLIQATDTIFSDSTRQYDATGF
ncbi:hypothetical protein GCM10027051_15800 [Niabella terrae]